MAFMDSGDLMPLKRAEICTHQRLEALYFSVKLKLLTAKEQESFFLSRPLESINSIDK